MGQRIHAMFCRNRGRVDVKLRRPIVQNDFFSPIAKNVSAKVRRCLGGVATVALHLENRTALQLGVVPLANGRIV